MMIYLPSSKLKGVVEDVGRGPAKITMMPKFVYGKENKSIFGSLDCILSQSVFSLKPIDVYL